LVQSLVVERLPYTTRACKRIKADTVAAIWRRVPPLVIAIVGIGVGALFNYLYLHKQTAKEMIEVALVSGIGANLIWILCVLVYNTVRVPWLLDAESGQQIDVLEARVFTAESKADESAKAKQENKREHEFFGALMQSGMNLSGDLIECRTSPQFQSWDTRFDEWIDLVRKAIADLGFYTDLVEFVRAGEYAESVSGAVHIGHFQENRVRVLEKHQEKLEEIVQRRLR